MSEIVLANTGEVVDPQALATDELARHVDDIREARRALADAERVLQDEVLTRMDRRGEWTATVGDYRLEASSPQAAVDYDESRLRAELEALVDEGLVDQAAANEAFRTVEAVRIMKGQVNRLAKLGGPVADRLAAARLPTTRPRRVKVTRRPARPAAVRAALPNHKNQMEDST